MNSIQININNKIIQLFGNNSIVTKEKEIIESIGLIGQEPADRLTIQKCIDKYKLKSSIFYEGSTVYPFEKIVKSYRKLQNHGSLEGLTKELYHFFMYACGDIAHYDIVGYKSYYNYSFQNLENDLLANCSTANRFSDIDRIFKELKIGKAYFNERNFIDISKLSVNQLKDIIEKCSWDVSCDNHFWNLTCDLRYSYEFEFKVDISSNNVLNIVSQIQDYAKNFDKDEYIKNMLIGEKKLSNYSFLKEIVETTNNFSYILSKLSSDILYKCRIAAVGIKSQKGDSVDLELELER